MDTRYCVTSPLTRCDNHVHTFYCFFKNFVNDCNNQVNNIVAEGRALNAR